MIRYDRLWAMMEHKHITLYRLIRYYNFSAGQIGRLKKNMHVSTRTLDTLCSILDCSIEDIIEYMPDPLSLSQNKEPSVQSSSLEMQLPAEAEENPKAADKDIKPLKSTSKKNAKAKKGENNGGNSGKAKEGKKGREGRKGK